MNIEVFITEENKTYPLHRGYDGIYRSEEIDILTRKMYRFELVKDGLVTGIVSKRIPLNEPKYSDEEMEELYTRDYFNYFFINRIKTNTIVISFKPRQVDLTRYHSEPYAYMKEFNGDPLFTPPGIIENLKAHVDESQCKVKFTWDPPKDTGGTYILKYLVCQNMNNIWMTTLKEEFTIHNVDSALFISIKAVNEAGECPTLHKYIKPNVLYDNKEDRKLVKDKDGNFVLKDGYDELKWDPELGCPVCLHPLYDCHCYMLLNGQRKLNGVYKLNSVFANTFKGKNSK